jgi:hypothetical protein
MADQTSLFDDEPFQFAERFLQDHAGAIITDGRTALLELIANAYDAGATKVEVLWPGHSGESFSVSDNGTGLTRQEFAYRWKKFNYDRIGEQGAIVKFPSDVKPVPRRLALGQSGKGRHASFCFSDKYTVTSKINGVQFVAEVALTAEGESPFVISYLSETKESGHGTTIAAIVDRHHLATDDLSQLIGSKFIVDPSFTVWLNGEPIRLTDLDGVQSFPMDVDGTAFTIHFIDSSEHTRTIQLRGITWWVNRRMVGEPGWNRLDDDGAYLDGRTEQAKRFSFVIEADALKYAVKSDWSGFHADKLVNAVKEHAHEFILRTIRDKLSGTRRERKVAALTHSRALLGELPTLSKNLIAEFIDEVQDSCPTMSDRDLERTVKVLATLEQSRGGYDLLTKLEACTPDDLDTWNDIMSRWTAENANVVLNELERRLTLITKMEQLVGSPLADELHDLQPLFERGLWIFGPEYEAVDFRSNRGLTEIIGSLLGAIDVEIDGARRRTDFVALADTSIGAYSADNYAGDGEALGIRKVLIVELKKGGFKITQKEIDQARDYAREIRRVGSVQRDTQIEAYIIGDSLEEGLEPQYSGDPVTTTLRPIIYKTILRRAHVRTFNLQSRLKARPPLDKEVQEVLQAGHQEVLFSGPNAG